METHKNMLLCFAAGNDRNDGAPDANTNWYIWSINQGSWVEIDRNQYPLAPNPDEGFNTIDTTSSVERLAPIADLWAILNFFESL